MRELVTSSRSPRLRLLTLVVVAGLVLGAGVGFVRWRTNSSESFESFSDPLTSLSGLDLVVRVEGPAMATGDSLLYYGDEMSVLRLPVAEVLYSSGATDQAEVRSGDVLTVSELEFGGLASTEVSPGDYAFLGHVDLGLFPEFGASPWAVMLVASETDGQLQFSGTTAYDGAFTAAVVETRAALIRNGSIALARDNALEFVFAWADEIRDWETNRPDSTLDEAGPLTRAYDSRHRIDVAAVWRDTDPKLRALHPDVVPGDVLADLTWRSVLLAFPAHTRSDEFFVVLRNDLGVMEITDAVVGTHPIEVLTADGSTWEIIITRDIGTMNGPVVARFPGPTNEAEHTVITLDQTVIDAALATSDASLTRLDSWHRFVDKQEYRTLLDDLADISE